jgi:hypothetical protein
VTLLAINTNQASAASLELAAPAERYTLSARTLNEERVQLNGRELALGPGDALPVFEPTRIRPGRIELAAASMTFVAVPTAGNPGCK